MNNNFLLHLKSFKKAKIDLLPIEKYACDAQFPTTLIPCKTIALRSHRENRATLHGYY